MKFRLNSDEVHRNSFERNRVSPISTAWRLEFAEGENKPRFCVNRFNQCTWRISAQAAFKTCKNALLCCALDALSPQKFRYKSTHRNGALLLPAPAIIIGNTPPPSCPIQSKPDAPPPASGFYLFWLLKIQIDVALSLSFRREQRWP